ncbi:VWA domain-containing protein [Corynebacterium sp. MC-04]|uniref:VWA domain-containing protein n=4 Tax=Corynebacteriaceae TaxID=1653 RepID=A0ABS9HLD7_9CORY|nr:VWA domain-containing protein [Corynebacterium parakroppenstedtii]MDU3198074.1 VWA domain-containing protein [Corynebacterium kroppenstedtii]MCF6771747.1 VWA domain-containing protein [Corynebacterium parakroppenstedtii]MCF6773840.1 VWA domain-containing protein [Corynebacterium parakroppenstedtii]MCF6779031.1 VWA domain-containing protein [Corynebacterium parakroppenstedtii]MCF6787530.1 VWA domain-containing protein [Corynebacterium parakroppenstedtii]
MAYPGSLAHAIDALQVWVQSRPSWLLLTGDSVRINESLDALGELWADTKHESVIRMSPSMTPPDITRMSTSFNHDQSDVAREAEVAPRGDVPGRNAPQRDGLVIIHNAHLLEVDTAAAIAQHFSSCHVISAVPDSRQTSTLDEVPSVILDHVGPILSAPYTTDPDMIATLASRYMPAGTSRTTTVDEVRVTDERGDADDTDVGTKDSDTRKDGARAVDGDDELSQWVARALMTHLGSQATPGLLLDAIYMAHAARTLGRATEHVHEAVVDMFIRPRLPEDVDDSDFDDHPRNNDGDYEDGNEKENSANPSEAQPEDADTQSSPNDPDTTSNEEPVSDESSENSPSRENDSGDTSREERNDPPHNDDASTGEEARNTDPVDKPDDQPLAIPHVPRRGRTSTAVWPGRHGPRGISHRGRVRRVMPARTHDTDLAILPTLAAAAPWQRFRHRRQDDQQKQSGQHDQRRIILTRDDLRTAQRESAGGELVIIIVDASGSMGRGAIRTAKSTALEVLQSSYRDRSKVCIIVARGHEAAIGLPVTRSLSRARRCLTSLPTGGGTPLASARLRAANIARRFPPELVRVIELSDGRANVGLPHSHGTPTEDAEKAKYELDAVVSSVTCIPVSSRGRSRRRRHNRDRRN